jgi:hypothetical protein
VKALTIWQPYASLIGAKTIETRGWATSHRGELLICAAARCDRLVQGFLAGREIQRALAALLPGAMPNRITIDDLPLGAAVAVVELVDCLPVGDLPTSFIRRELPFGDFRPGRFGWLFKRIRRIKPFPVVGRQGLFEVEINQPIEVDDD